MNINHVPNISEREKGINFVYSESNKVQWVP